MDKRTKATDQMLRTVEGNIRIFVLLKSQVESRLEPLPVFHPGQTIDLGNFQFLEEAQYQSRKVYFNPEDAIVLECTVGVCMYVCM